MQSEQQISATLGTEQLRNGLIAGLIGFALIILYLAWQYRGLAVVAVASLVVAAAGTYLVIAALSATMGYPPVPWRGVGPDSSSPSASQSTPSSSTSSASVTRCARDGL